MASPMAFPKVIGMECCDVTESSTFWGTSGIPSDVTGSSSPEVTSYDDRRDRYFLWHLHEPSLKVTLMALWGHVLPVVFPGYFL